MELNPEALNNIQHDLEEIKSKFASAFASDLVSIVLFGSAAEGKLRSHSDVNLLVVLKNFAKDKIDPLRKELRVYRAKINLQVMFLLESEVAEAAKAFALKFQDIHDRHKVLFGADPVASISFDRTALKERTAQVLLNLTLRLRERYAFVSLREEQLWHLISEVAGPLRVSAQQILQLQNKSAEDNKTAFKKIAQEIFPAHAEKLSDNVSACREGRGLPAGEAESTLLQLVEVSQGMTAMLRKI